MSCISGQILRITGVTDASAVLDSGVANAALCRATEMPSADVAVVSGVLAAMTNRATGVENAQCSVVCFVNSTLFLRVDPQDSVWLNMVGESVDYSIYSNTQWQVV